jgi:predicted NodU family carbamoyl transferase
VVLWVPHVGLPSEMASDVGVEVFLSVCGEVTGEAVGQALATLQEITTSRNKRMQVNNVMYRYRTARAVHNSRIAWNLLQSRVGVDCWPCANWCAKEEVLAWAEHDLAI